MVKRFPLPFKVKTCSFSLSSSVSREYRDQAIKIHFGGESPALETEAATDAPFSAALNSFYVYGPAQNAGEAVNTQSFTPPPGTQYIEIEVESWLNPDSVPYDSILLHAETDWEGLAHATVIPEDIDND